MALGSLTFRILLLGVGTVGGAVLRILQTQHKNIQLAAVMSHNARLALQKQAPLYLAQLAEQQIFNSWAELETELENIGPLHAVIELLGGVENCLPIYRHFLQRGIPMVTANKALLAEHGDTLFPLAKENHTCIAFEASCGGGIPILQTLLYGLRANRIFEFHGVLNGTCNFILSEMVASLTVKGVANEAAKDRDYAEVLLEAQACGLAEADPYLDVSGTDSAHKLAILAMMSFSHSLKLQDIPTCGIENLGKVEILAGQKLGLTLKLLASAKRCENLCENLGDNPESSVVLRVGPCYIPLTTLGSQPNSEESDLRSLLGIELTASPLAALSDSFNGISFYGDNVGHIYLQGRGAGASATATAVLADLYQMENGSYPLAFAQFPNWPEPNKFGQQNYWSQQPQNWLGFAPSNLPIEDSMENVPATYTLLFELEGYRVFFEKHCCWDELMQQKNGEAIKYIPILEVPKEILSGELLRGE